MALVLFVSKIVSIKFSKGVIPSRSSISVEAREAINLFDACEATTADSDFDISDAGFACRSNIPNESSR